MIFTPEFQHYVDAWKNENDHNNALHAELTEKVNADPVLKAHRDFIEIEPRHGFGDRPFHYLWKMLVDQMPERFSFLEIGVYKGQSLSLIELLARQTGKVADIYGVTTLENTPDERCKYPVGDYRKWIAESYGCAGLSMDRTQLLVGKSSDPKIQAQLKDKRFEIVYIDGSHDYLDVVADIQFYSRLVGPSGFLLMDDASNLLNIGSCWPGIESASQAVRDVLEPDESFWHLLAVGHLRVFQSK